MWVRPLRAGIGISQAGFGCAKGGTIGCFVQDVTSGAIMLLSNMHVLQYFKSAPKLGILPWTPQSQLDIVQPDVAELLVGVYDDFNTRQGMTMDETYAAFWEVHHPILPNQPLRQAPGRAEAKEFYEKKAAEALALLVKTCTVATYTRGFLETDFDAAVATLTPGTAWSNMTPDNTQILAPPGGVAPSNGVWKYGDASGVKKFANAILSTLNENVPFKTYTQDSGTPGQRNAGFNQIPITFRAGQVWKVTGIAAGTFQVQGDSGSVLCDANDRLVALMSTGGFGADAYAIPIDVVFQRLNVQFPAAPSGTA
jgi:hypothetical protein